MPCSCLAPCEVPSLVPVEVHSGVFESSAFHSSVAVFDPVDLSPAADVDVIGVLLLFYALAVLLLLPFVWYRQRHSSWVLLNLSGLRAVSIEPRRSRAFRLVLSERERLALRRIWEAVRGALGATPHRPPVYCPASLRSPSVQG